MGIEADVHCTRLKTRGPRTWKCLHEHVPSNDVTRAFREFVRVGITLQLAHQAGPLSISVRSRGFQTITGHCKRYKSPLSPSSTRHYCSRTAHVSTNKFSDEGPYGYRPWPLKYKLTFGSLSDNRLRGLKNYGFLLVSSHHFCAKLRLKKDGVRLEQLRRRAPVASGERHMGYIQPPRTCTDTIILFRITTDHATSATAVPSAIR